MKRINSTPNGQLLYCEGHRTYHIEFGNLFLNMSPEHFESFKTYLNTIQWEYYLERNKNAANRRKLVVNIGSQSIFMGLTSAEFMELRRLLNQTSTNRFLDYKEVIDFEILFN